MNSDDHINTASAGYSQPTRIKELPIGSFWGLDEIRRLVSCPWHSIRDFAVEHGVVSDGLLTRHNIREWWPWRKPGITLCDPMDFESRGHASRWGWAMVEANIFAEPAGPKLRERSRGHKLLRQARCIKAGRSVAECIESMLGRSVAEHLERKFGRALTAEERVFCRPPLKTCGDYEEAIAAASVAYGMRVVNLEGYYWLWVRAELLGAVRRLEGVLNAIQHDRIPYEQYLRALHPEPELVTSVALVTRQTGDGRVSCTIAAPRVWPNCSDWDANWPANTIPSYLLASATFEVMQEVDKYFRERGPAFVVTCRNPLCGEQFYSRDKRAVVCPKPSGSKDDRSPCKQVWDAYRKFLQKIGKNSDTDWPDEKLRSAFAASYQTRGPQSGLR